MSAPTILAMSASERKNSLNKKLLALAIEAAEKAGAKVTRMDLRALELPIYDGDVEETKGLPAGAIKLKEAFADHQGLLIATPEYNGSIPPLLKNAIDWASRPAADKRLNGLEPLRDKVCALMAASPGRLGGMRCLNMLNQGLSGIGVLVVPGFFSLSFADKAFDDNGRFVDDKQHAALEKFVTRLITMTRKLNA